MIQLPISRALKAVGADLAKNLGDVDGLRMQSRGLMVGGGGGKAAGAAAPKPTAGAAATKPTGLGAGIKAAGCAASRAFSASSSEIRDSRAF